MDINSILYSMPTIATDSLDYVVPTKESFKNAVSFHEDNWRQLEFYPLRKLDEIKQMLTEYHAFETQNRATSGWKNIYLREISCDNFQLTLHTLTELKAVQILPAPILTTTSSILGQVKGGFTILIGDGAFLYGVINDDNIVSLAANVHSDEGNSALTTTFMNLNNIESLLLVDWRRQLIITNSSNGQLNIWQP